MTKGKRRSGQLVGYLRVSSLDQKELRQRDGITLDKRFREGIALAKLREGTYVGRKPSLNPAQAKDLRRRVAAGESNTALAAELGISRMTIYRYAGGVGK